MKNKKRFYKLILPMFIIAVFSGIFFVKFKDKDKACNTYSELVFDIESEEGDYSDDTEVFVFIHSDHKLNSEEIGVVENLGATVAEDSWIPPLQNHPTGFYTSSVKLGNVCKLSKVSFIKKINSAMKRVDPSSPSVLEPRL